MIIIVLRVIAIDTLPNSPYSAVRFVDLLTPRLRRRNFVCIISTCTCISEASWFPQISAPKFSTDPIECQIICISVILVAPRY